MPESLCLHIQDRESGPIRVVDIPWISVSIGSAAYCEVRLTDCELAEEACRLQRRGRNWHLFPLGPKGSVLVQDRPIDGPCPLPVDVPFRVGSICFTLRRSRSADPDWEMYRKHAVAEHRFPQPPIALSSSMPAVERSIAAVKPASLQRRTIDVPSVPPAPHVDVPSAPPAPHVDVPSVPPAPHVESPVERSLTPQPVNPWEARWKAAGARLQADRKKAGPAAERYQSIPLKEPSVPSSLKTEPAVSPSRSTGFTARLLTTTSAPAYTAPPSIPPIPRIGADSSTRSITQPSRPGVSDVSFEKITSYDWQPALPWQTRDQSSPINSPYQASSEVPINPIDDAWKQSEPENEIEPTVAFAVVAVAESEEAVVERVAEEVNHDFTFPGHDQRSGQQPTDLHDGPTSDDETSGTKLDSAETVSQPVPPVLEPSESEVLTEDSHREERLDREAGIGEPVERFVADTSWTATNSYLEASSSEVIMSISTEACRHLEVDESESRRECAAFKTPHRDSSRSSHPVRRQPPEDR